MFGEDLSLAASKNKARTTKQLNKSINKNTQEKT